MLSRRSTVKGLLCSTFATRLVTGNKAFAQVSANGYSVYRFGWLPDSPSTRSLAAIEASRKLAEFVTRLPENLPNSVDLRPQMPPVYDQHQIGSCTSNAIAACMQFVRKKNNQPPDARLSRLFIYYFGRQKENAGDQDAGLSISDAISVCIEKGVPLEADWPYDGTPADDKGKLPSTSRAVAPPPQAVINEAVQHKITSAGSLANEPQRLDQLKACLAQGYPFVFGFTIYKSFFDNNQEPALALSNIPMPPTIDQPVGGHAAVAVGYDAKNFICRNSWGLMDIADRDVQDKGHFYMPYDYILDNERARDFWTIRAMSG